MFIDCFISLWIKKKKKAGSLARSYPKKITHFRVHRFMLKKIVLYSNKGTINYNQQCHPLHLGNKQHKQFPQKKKKKLKKEKGRRKEEKKRVRTRREMIRKRRRKEGKRGRENANGKEKEKV